MPVTDRQVLTKALRKAPNRELRRNIRGAIGATYQSLTSEHQTAQLCAVRTFFPENRRRP